MKLGLVVPRLVCAAVVNLRGVEPLSGFIQQHIAPGSTIYTDALKSFTGLDKAGYRHIARAQPKTTELRKGAKSVVPLADRAIGNLQQWLIGTYHGVSRAQLQDYLDEFVLRHNRRNQPMAAFQTLLGLGTQQHSTAYGRIRGALDLAKTSGHG
jgi:transposase-like protein